MTAPPFAHVAITDSEVAQKAAPPVLAYRNDLEHLRSVTLDPEIHAPAVAHTHDGAGSGHIYWPSPNLIPHASLNNSTAGSSKTEWMFSKTVTFGDYDGTDPGARLLNEGEYLWTEVGSGDRSDVDDMASENAFGAGAPMVCAAYVRTTATLTRGELRFGLADVSRGSFEQDGGTLGTIGGGGSDFMAGCSAAVDWTDLSTSWARYWFRCRVGDVGSSLSLRIRVTEGFDVAVRVDCVGAWIGTSLPYWAPMPNDKSMLSWQRVSRTVPVWAEAVSITSAVRLPPS